LLSFVLAMLAVLFSWAALGALLVGLGMLVLGWAKPVPWRPERVFTCFWLGYLAAIALLQIWHLFVPVGGAALVVLATLSLAGVRFRGAGLLSALRGSGSDRWRLWAVVALFALWLANRALGPPVGDSGLYHLSAVRWFTSFPIVPGLANLHHRFGFNNPSLLWAALLEIGPWHGRSSHLANGLLGLAIALRGLLGLSRVWRTSSVARPIDLFAALLLPVAVAQAVSVFELRLSSLDPDAAAALVALAAASHLVVLLTEPKEDRAEIEVSLFAAASLAILASCIKLSLGPFSVGLVVVALVASALRIGVAGVRAPLGAWAGAATVLVIPWLVRSVVLSGYPLFPLLVLPFDVDWLVPRAHVEIAAQLIREHFMPPVAQQMRGAGEGWVRPWLVWQVTRLPELVPLPTVLCISAPVLARRAKLQPARRVLWLLPPCILAALVWIATAPHPRFGYSFFWTAAAACLTAATFAAAHRRGSRRRALLLLLLAGTTAFPAIHRIAAWAWLRDVERAAQSVALGPGPDHGFFPTPIAKLRTEMTRTGLAVHVPESGSQVWDAPLPATPDLTPGLTLRSPSHLRSGFRVRQ